MSNDVRFRAVLDDRISGGLDKIRTQFDKSLGKTSSAVTFGAVGAKAIEKGFGLIDTAVSGVIGVLGDAKQAYQDDQASQAKLYQSLSQNAKGWDGNKDAIEAVLGAREKLGFSDDEQRDSLATLVTRTHDVNKALEIQRTAMDLARLRGIDLGTATDLLGKAYDGQVGALRRAGIAVDAHATSEEALLAVQQAAAGQAEQYANTDAGKEAAAHQKVQEAMEKIGGAVSKVAEIALPILADAFSFIVDVVGNVIQGVQNLLAPLAAVNDFIGSIPGPWHHAADEISAATDQINSNVDELTKNTQLEAALTSVSMESNRKDWAGFAATVETAESRVRTAVGRTRDQMLRDAQDTVHGYYSVLIAEDNLAATNAEIAAQRRIIASHSATAKEKADARTKLHQLESDQEGYLETLATAGKTETKVFTTTMAGLYDRLKTAHGDERKAILAEIKAMQQLASQSKITAAATAFHGLANDRGRASGGPVFPGQTYTVGEQGAETLVMGGSGGYVIPNGGSRGSSGGGERHVIHSHIYLNGREIAQAVDEEGYWSAATAGGSPAGS